MYPIEIVYVRLCKFFFVKFVNRNDHFVITVINEDFQINNFVLDRECKIMLGLDRLSLKYYFM